MPAKSTMRFILWPLSILLLVSAHLCTAKFYTYTLCVFTGSRKSASRAFVHFEGKPTSHPVFIEFRTQKDEDNEVNSRKCYRIRHFHYGPLRNVYLARTSIGTDRDWKVKRVTVKIHYDQYTCTNGTETTVNEIPVKLPCQPDLASHHGSSVLVLITMCTMPVLLTSLL